MFKRYLLAVLAVTQLLTTAEVIAHGRYILPSHTQLSGEAPYSITLSSSISNDLFHPDNAFGNNPVCWEGDVNEGKETNATEILNHCNKGWVSPRLKNLFGLLESYVVTPSGSIESINWQAFSRMSVADLFMQDSGSYRVGLRQPEVLMLSYTDKSGSPARQFGPAAKAPAGATNIIKRSSQSRVETYVSVNDYTVAALKPLGKGLELVADNSHPNEIFVGEKQHWQLVLNGKALTQAADIKVVREGTRHRNQRNAMNIKTDQQGRFQTQFDKAGFYWLEIELEVAAEDDAPVDVYNYGLYQTWEVFPE